MSNPEALKIRQIERRAVEAAIWGMPAVNFQLMLDAFRGLGGKPNQVIYWSRPVNWKNQALTPNPDTIYFTAFYDTRSGPVVLEIPAAGDGSFTGFSSQECSRCGHIARESRRRRRFCCVGCGYCNHADVNAALVIRGRAQLALKSEPYAAEEAGRRGKDAAA
jgi:hypothetical protein